MVMFVNSYFIINIVYVKGWGGGGVLVKVRVKVKVKVVVGRIEFLLV